MVGKMNFNVVNTSSSNLPNLTVSGEKVYIHLFYISGRKLNESIKKHDY